MALNRFVAAVGVLSIMSACSSQAPNDSTAPVVQMPSPDNVNQTPPTTAGAGSQPMNAQPMAGSGSVLPTNMLPMDQDPPMMDGDPPVTGPTVTPEQAKDPLTPLAMLPASCRGFEVAGLKFSPGGDVLPNTCAPFDNMNNNPFAIRCIDADASWKTAFPGDEYCILPPDPKDGTQVHMGPASYDNPDPSFIMRGGEEITDWYYTKAPNTEEHYFYRLALRMRAGSHHMINRLLDAPQADGFQPFGDLSFGNGPGSRSFQGAQRTDTDRPEGAFAIAPENQGLGDKLLVNQQFSLNLHHFNFGESDVLREVWINIWYVPQAEVKNTIEAIAAFGNPLDVTIAPGASANLQYACDITADSRIITLNGHRHSHTTRFGVWLVRDGGEIPLYDSFHYDDMPTYQYDSVSTNPAADGATRTDGAFTGILNVKSGDKLHFECDIVNDSQNTLRFANEVETGEMCILFGSRVGASVCDLPARVQ